jgi:hypothetical protein
MRFIDTEIATEPLWMKNENRRLGSALEGAIV